MYPHLGFTKANYLLSTTNHQLKYLYQQLLLVKKYVALKCCFMSWHDFRYKFRNETSKTIIILEQ